jgi:hypothetical protein
MDIYKGRAFNKLSIGDEFKTGQTLTETHSVPGGTCRNQDGVEAANADAKILVNNNQHQEH